MTSRVEFFEQVEVGDHLPEVRYPPVTRVQIAKFAGAVQDFNPIHLDEPFAVAAGLPSVIAHGPLSLALLAALLEQWVSVENVRRISARFMNMCPPGTELTCRGTVTRKWEEDGWHLVEVELVAENQERVPITTARAVAALRSRRDE